MCFRNLLIAAAACALLYLWGAPHAAAAVEYPERSWTNDQGKTIEARMLRASGTTAILRQDGENIRAPIARLSEADQAWIEQTKALGKYREWTLADGTKRKARLSSFEDGKLELKEKGEIAQFDLDDLASADQQLIAQVFNANASVEAASATADLQLGTSDFRPASATTRSWTDMNGKTIEAEFRGTEGDKIVLYFKDREWRVPLWRFSQDDKQFVATARAESLGARSLASNLSRQSQNTRPQNTRPNVSSTFSPPSASPGPSRNRAEEIMREQQARMQRDAEQRARQQQERLAQMERDRQQREQQAQQRREAEQRQRDQERERRERQAADSWSEQGQSGHPGSPNPAGGQWVNEYICFSCNHTWESAKELGVNDKCPNCGVRFDYVEDEDGNVVDRSPRSYRGIIRLVVFAVIGIGGMLARMSRS